MSIPQSRKERERKEGGKDELFHMGDGRQVCHMEEISASVRLDQ